MGTSFSSSANDRKDKGDALAHELGMELFSKRGTFVMRRSDERGCVAGAGGNRVASRDRRHVGQPRRRNSRRRDQWF